jgi:hypothetical protein
MGNYSSKEQNITYIPEWMKTATIPNEAVENNTYNLQYIPENMNTAELCLIALLNGGNHVLMNMTIRHAEPKQMPDKAYDTLQMGYDDDTAIVDGEMMVDFHKEFENGRFYRKKTFDELVLRSKNNPLTRERITEYTIYQAIVS